jgi:aldose 1-epimerase
MIVLSDNCARVEIHPSDGAAIGRYDLTRPDRERLPILQTAPSPGRAGPFRHGLNLLVPFSNRISGGGFSHDGRFYPLEPNTPGPYPIHGNAFQLPWTVSRVASQSATLNLVSDGPGAFRYDATVAYSLGNGALFVRLTVVNRAVHSLPFGAGLHPWFVRTPDARLSMHATGYWTETEDHLPDSFRQTAGDARFDFGNGSNLPSDFVNNAITGWNGRATLGWPARKLCIDIVAAPPLSTVILYSPSPASDFVCIEPVSHSVDAHNRHGPGSAPPQVLQPEEELVVVASFTPRALHE